MTYELLAGVAVLGLWLLVGCLRLERFRELPREVIDNARESRKRDKPNRGG